MEVHGDKKQSIAEKKRKREEKKSKRTEKKHKRRKEKRARREHEKCRRLMDPPRNVLTAKSWQAAIEAGVGDVTGKKIPVKDVLRAMVAAALFADDGDDFLHNYLRDFRFDTCVRSCRRSFTYNKFSLRHCGMRISCHSISSTLCLERIFPE